MTALRTVASTLQSATPQAADSTASAWMSWLEGTPFSPAAVGLVALGVVAILSHLVARSILLQILHRIVSRTKFTWDDTVRDHKVFHRLAQVAPALVVYLGIQVVPDLAPDVVAAAAQAFLSAVNVIYNAEYEDAKSRPIKGYLQIVAIFLWIAAGIVALSLVMNRSPGIFLSGLGALTAVLLLVFRTTILSFVASIQIASNDMVRVGDWIEMPQFGADGDVVDIALHTVKVQNWDKTITTIPTHALVEHSFKNWRAMSESGGRRIKRALMLDMGSIRFLKRDEMERLERLELLNEYLSAKQQELAGYKGMRPDKEGLDPTPRRLTNVGTFRAYVLAYLQAHPAIHKEMTLLVRQLAPTPHGLPLELYCFTNDVRWAVYEDVQADIFDHLLSMAPEFGLRVFQQPAGSDLAGVLGQGREGAGPPGPRFAAMEGEGGSGPVGREA